MRAIPNQHAEQIALHVVESLGEHELERTYLCGAVVERQGEHFRICAGEETEGELRRHALGLRGACGCGAPLSMSFRRRFCRRCDP